MDTGKLLEGLFDPKLLRLLKFFLTNQNKQYTLQEISKGAKVPLATTHRSLAKLLSLGVLQETGIKNLRLYHLPPGPTSVFLEGFLLEGGRILEDFVEQVKNVPGIEEIILHGKEQEDKANILLIGKMIDHQAIKTIAAEFREKKGFTLTTLTLEREQYEQMSAMGLYAGSKKTLFKL